MSSTYVRTQIKNFIATELPTENLIDLTGKYQTIHQMLKDAGLTYKDPWLGIQFVGNDEVPWSVGSNNSSGCYRELGSVFLHIVEQTKATAIDEVLTRGTVLRNTLRGQRIGDIIVESVSPVNTETGATLDLEAGFLSGSIILNYYRDLNY